MRPMVLEKVVTRAAVSQTFLNRHRPGQLLNSIQINMKNERR